MNQGLVLEQAVRPALGPRTSPPGVGAMDRRRFVGALIAGGVAIASVTRPASARPAHSRVADALGLLYDSTLCVGCGACVAACPLRVPRVTDDSTFPQISKCQLCRHRLAKGGCPACAEVCPTGATLFGRVGDLRKEAERRLALAPGTPTVYPRGRIDGPDQSYMSVSKKYVNRLYGDTGPGGTQLLMLAGVPFERLGHPTPKPDSDACAIHVTDPDGGSAIRVTTR